MSEILGRLWEEPSQLGITTGSELVEHLTRRTVSGTVCRMFESCRGRCDLRLDLRILPGHGAVLLTAIDRQSPRFTPGIGRRVGGACQDIRLARRVAAGEMHAEKIGNVREPNSGGRFRRAQPARVAPEQ